MTVNPEPRGLVASPSRAPVAIVGQPPSLEAALDDIRTSITDVHWAFPSIETWRASFTSLEETLPLLATLEAGQRYLWWVSGDIAEALMLRFGRTEAVKRCVGSVFNCKARAIEYRCKAATTFAPDRRYPDVPTELYREALLWDDPIAVLEAALVTGQTSVDLRNRRQLAAGCTAGSPIWTSQRAYMSWVEVGLSTHYTIRIVEEGGARFATRGFPVIVTVAPALEGESDQLHVTHGHTVSQEWSEEGAT